MEPAVSVPTPITMSPPRSDAKPMLPGRRSPMPSDIDSKLPKGIDDIFDTMTRDSQSERYGSVEDIIEDFDKIDGMGNVLDAQTHVLVSDNPLRDVLFRPGSPMAQQLAGEAGPEETGSGSNDVLSSASSAFSGDEEDDKRRRRPYSFQQRHRKT